MGRGGARTTAVGCSRRTCLGTERMEPLRPRLEEVRQHLGTRWEVLERDYLLSWMLAGIDAVPELAGDDMEELMSRRVKRPRHWPVNMLLLNCCAAGMSSAIRIPVGRRPF